MLADEVTSDNKEELAICLGFVDKDEIIRGAFVGFLPPKRVTGVYIAETIISHLKKLGLVLDNIRGQGYDEPI